MTLQERPRYNGAGAVGRRLVEADESTSIEKADKPSSGRPTGGRVAAAYAGGPIHPLVAGRKGQKGKAFLRSGGETLGLSAPGMAMQAVGYKTRSIGLMRAGGHLTFTGGLSGSVHSTYANNAKGRYKAQVAKASRYGDSDGKKRARRAIGGAAVGAGAAHAPLAVYGSLLGNAMTGGSMGDAVRGVGHAYSPRTLRRMPGKYGAFLGAAGAAGAGIGAASVRGKKPVSKARHYDPEHRRQRRIGMGEAALLGAGGVLGFRGGRGIVRTTQAGRKIAGVTGKDRDQVVELHGALQRGIVARRRDLAQVGGGVAGITGAGALRQHAETRRGRAYE